MTEQDFLTNIRSICEKNGAKQVVLFGSRAKHTNLPMSDFDIAVSGTNRIMEIQEAIDDLPTLFSADIVDLDRLENQELKEDIRLYGIPV